MLDDEGVFKSLLIAWEEIQGGQMREEVKTAAEGSCCLGRGKVEVRHTNNIYGKAA